MTQYLYTRDKAFQFDLFGQITGWAYNSAEAFPRADLSYLETSGEHKLSTNTVSDLYYYILEGEATFVVGGERLQVKATDAVLVPKHTEYGYFGTIKYLLFMTPAFTEGCEIRTDISPRD